MTRQTVQQKRKLHRRWQRDRLISGTFCVLFPVYLELVLHLYVYRRFSSDLILPLLLGAGAGFMLRLVCALFPRRFNQVLGCLLTTLVTLYFGVQLTYHSIFSEFMSLWQVTAGADAVINFWQPMLYGIRRVLPQLLLLALPIPISVVLAIRLKFAFPRLRVLSCVILIVLALIAHFGGVGLMHLWETGGATTYTLYHSIVVGSDASIQNFGLLTTTWLEGRSILLGTPEESLPELTEPDEPVEQPEIDTVGDNVLPIDIEALMQSTDDPVLLRLDRRLASQAPTEKNEYTGLLKDYNLIALCCESFSPYLIDPARTPALYKLSTNGFLFENYFGSFASNTTNGEYTMCMGLFPDTSRAKSTASFFASQEHHLPFCLGNAFREQGVQTWAYHNYSGSYYSRNVTHPNMGYKFQAADSGLDMELRWPASDLEMMEKSVDDYLANGEQFCAYYMTFSGHYHYSWDNAMSAKNRASVGKLPYSETVKAYIACNMELEYALEYLMDRLEQAGVADKTVIALTNDHYPYGLTEEEYNELAGEPVDPIFDRFRNSFILYVPGMQVPVSTYCSTVDILPTLLNLFGLPYDSRLLAGTDILSPQAENVAILSDQSFVTPDYGFDFATGTVIPFGSTTPSTEEVMAQRVKVAGKFQFSADVLNSDYYAHVLLGITERGSAFESHQFTDIPNTFDINALTYFLENGLMEPISETEFGFEEPTTSIEYLKALSGMANAPMRTDAELLRWAWEQKITDWGQQGDTPCTRKEAALFLYRFARRQGLDVSLQRSYAADYRKSDVELTQEEQDALAWCYEKSLMLANGDMVSNFRSADTVMLRSYVVSVLYRYAIAYL